MLLLTCFIISLIFGISPLIQKYVLKFITVQSYIILSSIIFYLLCLIYTLVFYKKEFLNDLNILNNNKYLYLLIFIFINIYIYFFDIYILANYYYLYIIKENTTFFVVAIISGYPIFTVFFGYLLYEEYINIYQFIAILIICSGIIMLSLNHKK